MSRCVQFTDFMGIHLLSPTRTESDMYPRLLLVLSIPSLLFPTSHYRPGDCADHSLFRYPLSFRNYFTALRVPLRFIDFAAAPLNK